MSGVSDLAASLFDTGQATFKSALKGEWDNLSEEDRKLFLRVLQDLAFMQATKTFGGKVDETEFNFAVASAKDLTSVGATKARNVLKSVLAEIAQIASGILLKAVTRL